MFTQDDARRLMESKNFFGSEEARCFLGSTVTSVPEIPFSSDILRRHRGTSVLTLVSGDSILTLIDRFKTVFEPEIAEEPSFSASESAAFAAESGAPEWFLIPKWQGADEGRPPCDIFSIDHNERFIVPPARAYLCAMVGHWLSQKEWLVRAGASVNLPVDFKGKGKGFIDSSSYGGILNWMRVRVVRNRIYVRAAGKRSCI